MMQHQGNHRVEREALGSRSVPARAARTGHAWGAGRLPGLDQAALLALQRTAGNAAVSALLAQPDARPALHAGVPTVQRNGAPPEAATKTLPTGAKLFRAGDGRFFATNGK